MKISISLPSLYRDCCERTLRNIRDATRSDYEVILVSPFEPPIFERVTWIREEPGKGTGCNAGHAAAFAHMGGDFATPWVDDHFYVDGWDIAALRNYEEREEAFHISSPGRPFSLGLRHAWPHHVGTQFGLFYPYFPLIRRRYLDEIGWFDSGYLKGFADGDLAFRVWTAGGRCEWSEQGLIIVHHDDDRKAGVMFAQSDLERFVKTWGPRYGKGWDTSNLRGFNIDVEPQTLPEFVEGNSIFVNDPSFRERVLQKGWRP